MGNTKSEFVDGYYCVTEIAKILRCNTTKGIKEVAAALNLETRHTKTPVNVSGRDKLTMYRTRTDYYITENDLQKIKGSLHEG